MHLTYYITVQNSVPHSYEDAQKLCILHNFAHACLGFSVTSAYASLTKKHLAESPSEQLPYYHIK